MLASNNNKLYVLKSGGGSSETKYDLWSGSRVLIGSNAIASSDGVTLQLTNLPTDVTAFKRLVIRLRYKEGTSIYCPTFEPIILNDMPIVTNTQYRAALLATSSRATGISSTEGIIWNLEFRTLKNGQLQCICQGGLIFSGACGVTVESCNYAVLPTDYCCIYSVEGYV